MASILIIDDDEQITSMMTVALRKDSHIVETASNGKKGIRALERRPFDLVITDIVMPESDGIELLMWLKTQPVRPKVIAMSGGSPSLDQGYLLRMAEFMSADRTLPKPVELDVLRGAIRELLE